MKVESYVFFDGCCEEAMEFYCSALGAELKILARYKDSPEPPPPGMVPPGYENKVNHAQLRIGDTFVLAADGCGMHHRFEGFSLCLTAEDEKHAKKLFSALAEGGKVTTPLDKTFFSPCFGMVTDRFGVGWMVFVEAKH